jgi:hypothetical protein
METLAETLALRNPLDKHLRGLYTFRKCANIVIYCTYDVHRICTSYSTVYRNYWLRANVIFKQILSSILKEHSHEKGFLDYLFKSQIRAKLRYANPFLIFKSTCCIATNFYMRGTYDVKWDQLISQTSQRATSNFSVRTASGCNISLA